MSKTQPTLFDGARMRLDDAIELSLASLNSYGANYRHWAVVYSGGKDSSATAVFVMWAIQTGLVSAPESLTILYADTRMELPPLQATAMKFLEQVRNAGSMFGARVVLPDMDDRFFVYMFGRGVPPPKNRFRWCTPQLKVEPMLNALSGLRTASGEKLLMLTGVRIGESAARDQRIALSCSKDGGECGQGWFQTSTPDSIADTLAPLLHWRLCHVYDWLYFEQDRHKYDVSTISAVYGDDEVRTGCVGCNLVERDEVIERLVKRQDWQHLRPLLELKPLYRELQKSKWRKRKSSAELRKDGKYSLNPQRLGPLTMEARQMGLERVLDIQGRARVDLINAQEEARIRELWALNTWPRKWSDADINGIVPIDRISIDSGNIVTKPLMTAIFAEKEA